MIQPTPFDLLCTPRDRETIEAILLSTLQGEKFPVTDWYPGGVAQTILKMLATGLLDRESLIGYIAAGGFLDLAAALTDPNGIPIEAWLIMLADQQYDRQRAPAAFTRKQITLTCSTGAGPYTRGAGELRAVSQSGNYYVNTDAVTVPDGKSVVAVFQCEAAGPINDDTGTIDSLTTPLPGLAIVDAQTQFSVPIRFWAGTGSIAASASGMPSPPCTMKVTITATGRIGSAYAKVDVYSVDSNGNSVITGIGPALVTSTLTVPRTTNSITLTFTDGPSTMTSFVRGDTWFISTPGEPTLQNGSDAESLASLAQRCRDRWPELSIIPTEGKYATWVRQCSVDSALGINRVNVEPSNDVPGVVNVHVADARGTATPYAVTVIQNYIDRRSVDLDRANVSPAESVPITVSGFVWVARAQLLAVKAAVKLAWDSYLATVPIGGDKPMGSAPPVFVGGAKPTGIVRCSKLDQILQDAGAYNSESLSINGGGTDVDLALTANQVPAASASGTDALTWYEVD
jgi:hypothetical protein